MRGDCMLNNGGKVVMYGTSVPNRAVEHRTPANSEVKPYKLSPEELEYYRNKYPTEKLACDKPNTVKVSIDEYWKRKKQDKPSELKIGRLTIKKYTELKEQGLSDLSIMNEANMSYAKLNALKHKWGLIQ